MSKRAEQKALEAYPAERGHLHDRPFQREGFVKGYEQAEKDTIERVCKWLKKNATYIHPRTGRETCIINLNALREAMEDE